MSAKQTPSRLLPKKRGDQTKLIAHIKQYTELSAEGIRKVLARGGEPQSPLIAAAWRKALKEFPGFSVPRQIA